MLLVFEGIGADEPIRPVQVAAVLSGLEEVFLVTLLRDAPPPDHRRREWVWDYDAQSLHVGLAGLRLESPLRDPARAPVARLHGPFSAFAYGVAHVFGAPAHRRAAVRPRPRGLLEQPPRGRAARSAEWMEWQAWLEYKHEEVERTVPFRLAEVDIALTLPPEPGRAARLRAARSWAYSWPMRIRIIDAFTDRPFAGNPAAVCLLDADTWPDEALDAAGRRGAAPVGDRVRPSAPTGAQTTPTGRCAGSRPRSRPTSAATRRWPPRTPCTATAARRAPCASSAAAGSSSRTPPTTAPSRSTSRPRPPPRCPPPRAWPQALGATPEATYATGALGDLLAVFANEAAVRALAPDFGAVARLARRDGIRGIIATASAPGGGRRLRLRLALLRPRRRHPGGPGHRQRPHRAGAVLVRRLGRDGLTGLQASARGGLVRTSLHGDRVHLTGHAVVVLDGTLTGAAVSAGGGTRTPKACATGT